MIGIYKITSPKGKVYIGQAYNIEKRWAVYKRLACKAQIRLYASFKKYGVDKHKFEVITYCELNELNNLERYYQELFHSIGKEGLNCLLTKDENQKVKFSNETRLKMRNSQLGKKRSPESIEKGRMSSIGKKMPKSAYIKRAQTLKDRGWKHTEESKLKMSESHKKNAEKMSAKMSIFMKNKMSKLTDKEKTDVGKRISSFVSIKILHLDYGIFYDSVTEAAQSCHMCDSAFRKRINGFYKNNTRFIRI